MEMMKVQEDSSDNFLVYNKELNVFVVDIFLFQQFEEVYILLDYWDFDIFVKYFFEFDEYYYNSLDQVDLLIIHSAI